MQEHPKTATPTAPPRVALWIDQDEANAFLSMLLTAVPTDSVSRDMVDRLLRRIADAHRDLDRTFWRPRREEAPAAALSCREQQAKLLDCAG